VGPEHGVKRLPYRGRFGTMRPDRLRDLPLPPARMPARRGRRPLKAWRYVGVFGPDLMLCVARVRIGPARQSFWAVWDRATQRLYQRTALTGGAVELGPGRALVRDGGVEIELVLEETDGIECVCPCGHSYAWTRKQGGIAAHGTIRVKGSQRAVNARGIVDDTAAYYERHTAWRWSAGVGTGRDGAALAWNVVDGVNDPPQLSERTLWVDGEPQELEATRFAADLSRVGDLAFHAEAERTRKDNLFLVRSRYRQPFGTFSGTVGGHELATGYGVMEDHDVYW
jgi:hypothetical protein